MNFFGRAQEKRDRKERRTPPPPPPPCQPSSSSSAPLSRRPDSSGGGGDSPAALTVDSSCPCPDFDQVIDDNESEQALNQQSAKQRRTVSISRSGRFRSKNKNRTRILSEEIYCGTTPVQTTATGMASPPPTTAPNTASTILIKPSGREKSPARPFIILQSETAVSFAIESTTL